MKQVERGWRDRLDKYLQPDKAILITMDTIGGAVYDYCCFGVDATGKLSDDRYMIFYNQTESPAGEIKYAPDSNGCIYFLELSKLPAAIHKLVFTVSIDGAGTMGEIQFHRFTLGQDGRTLLSLKLDGDSFQAEKAIITAEIYRKDGWRAAFYAHGFNGGLDALLHSYGGVALEDEETPVVSTAQANPVPPARTTPSPTPTRASPVPSPVTATPTTKTVLAIPVTLAGQVDGLLQPGMALWYYGTRCARMPDVVAGVAPAIPNGLGPACNEPPVMDEIIRAFPNPATPVQVIFLSTGGVGRSRDIREMLARSANTGIFWRFIGVGGAGYGILNAVETVAANASFVRVNRVAEIPTL